ncbi:hypothetical protein [Ciceribacter sp. L1K22]|uniref:hypothetical protein n=1 Tax=Ciceribacter sp. L1K22 TaxID=2820275 RepID=UPI001ABE2DBC|nr:hypothetical protein [Ciceribacter sp. L1K22]MBO3759849.1 hypothetical protein [Ciceribacter sp. L1K22]
MTGEEAIRALQLSDRPLVVCDVDDVVLQFLHPFRSFLQSRDYRLVARSFRLTGNIVREADGEALEESAVRQLIEAFFAQQANWQTPADLALETLSGLSAHAEVVFLTAMPYRHFDQRRRLLDRHGFNQPLIATEEAKGPLVRLLRRNPDLPIAFVDDMVHNLSSVGSHVEDCMLVHLQPVSDIHVFAPATPAIATRAADWRDAEKIIRMHLAATSC